MEGCAVVLLIILAVAVVISVAQAKDRQKAWMAYQNALQQLKGDPANPHLRESTLAWGRHYSNLTRSRRGVTLFDEVALMNDINAACAAAVIARPSIPAAIETVEKRLSRLKDLQSKGMITEAEYNDRRREILKEI